MNDLLELNGKLETSNFMGSVSISLPSKVTIEANKIDTYIKELEDLYNFWIQNQVINGGLISVYYNRIIPKTRRIERLLSVSSENSNMYVKGVRFDSTGNKHIITYYLKLDTIKIVIERLKKISNILKEICNGKINKDNFIVIDNNEKIILNKYNMSKSSVKIIIKDLIDIEKFGLFRNTDTELKSGYITLFIGDKKIEEVLNSLGISNMDYSLFEDDTIYTENSSVFEKIRNQASYLISMTMKDLSTYTNEDFNKIDPLFDFSNFKKPTNEPTIGVIDTLFSNDVYFKDWVEYHDLVSDDIEKNIESYYHGTEVDSIIVDGGHINPEWDDNCGNFKVRHFGVSVAGVNNSYIIISKIKEIVKNNLDIKVWNMILCFIQFHQKHLF